MLKYGLYEQVINKTIKEELTVVDEAKTKVDVGAIDTEEAAKVLTQYTAEVIEKGMHCLLDKEKDINAQINLANTIIQKVKEATLEADFADYLVDAEAHQLLALLKKQNTTLSLKDKLPAVRPQTSLAMSSLFTGSYHEPQMYEELKKEIVHCNRIDMLVSFIRWSGLRLILDELREFLSAPEHKLRVITTTYMGATEAKAIEELSKLPNTEIKISYDTERTRLHAKTYVFYRETGFTTAYVGSSNISNAAMTSGCEWNVKLTQKDMPETIAKICASFDSYWESNEFELYLPDSQEKLVQALARENGVVLGKRLRVLTVDAHPYPYQQAILDKLEAEREIRGHYKNLVVAATGTGKTIISAFDYRSYCEKVGRRARLLFVAHRKEILEQSLYCFQDVLKDLNFGELFVGGYKPKSFEHLFVSIQTLNSAELIDKVDADFYDFIIVDEFHHAGARSYQELLQYFKPKVLLGLTATPERTDGIDIYKYFDGHIAAEIRLPEAIDKKLLCPFQYFCVSDIAGLKDLKWKNGGYDKHELSTMYTMNEAIAMKRANLILQSTNHYVNDINEVKGIGFCVSVEHANYMAKFFTEHGVPSLAVTGQTSDEIRDRVKERLHSGELKFIFTVDVYNEGVDIPEVNTVLFLRPTESLIVFLQQLGRGLRLYKNKECLTVLDFVGQAHKKYNFASKFEALLGPGGSFTKELQNGFVSLPRGCYLKMEKQAREYILENIKSYFSKKYGVLERIRSFTEDSGKELSLTSLLDYYQMDPRELYAVDAETNRKYASLARLAVLAGVKVDFVEPMEETISKAFRRICAIDSRRWLQFLLELLPKIEQARYEQLGLVERRMVNMLQFTIWQKTAEDCGFKDALQGLRELKQNKVLFSELLELLQYKLDRIDFIDKPVDLGYLGSPLDLHCHYSRDQILVALDYFKPATVRQGVFYLNEKNIDVLFVTLNKSEKDYSPTTMYQDYAESEYKFHWQSQSTTSETSPTGQRYINGTGRILLFVRSNKNDACGAAPYNFLGLAKCVKHSGSKPINILWELEEPINAEFLLVSNKLAL